MKGSSKNDDCYFFYYSSCTKVSLHCIFSFNQSPKLVSAAGDFDCQVGQKTKIHNNLAVHFIYPE